ncbi:MAG TPA: class IV adenylate cyclase [Candidatus Nanoarchaeia archaeon]|nr:class IV adenylate cyclase [Candidatus Nanoarchaeia archaeon]
MIEREVKIKLDGKEVERLVKLLGKPDYFPQKNLIYILNRGYLRIRREKGKTIVCLKGNNQSKNFFLREEIEFSAGKSDFKKIVKLFSRLGYNKSFEYKKRRANFYLNNCVVSIDILPNLASYAEIEGDKKNIHKNLEILGLDKCELENKSYVEILNENKQNNC